MRVGVIGGGAAGLIAAGSCKNAEVVLFDHNEKLGKKLYITGKGRCNFTNVCDNNEFLSNVVNNAPFLRSALSKFTPYDAMELIENNGCKTKVERGRRAFPQSDKASDITAALRHYAESNGVRFRLNVKINSIEKTDAGFILDVDNAQKERFDRVIICSGGLSYPSTGSDGSMHDIIKRFGHEITPCYPSLVGLETVEDLSDAEGLTLKNVTVSADKIPSVFGDLMITDVGISGPIALTMSAYAAKREFPYDVYIDFKPALSDDELDKRIIKDFSTRLNKQLKNALDDLLPNSIIRFIIDKSGVSGNRVVNSVTKAERSALCDVIKHFRLTVSGTEGFSRAVVTSGGVNVKQINPKTMESKLVSGLYFGGEVIDVDALTGGYNIQIALSTGYVAGVSAGEDNG
ncbi:MAG: NAD(P)/FAD-dependent oxidoreductase [Clostridiales bacterium]|nr:NAD(P)/FAD-dependent oxidoreductase [Clostridiales bacterium]